MKLNYINISLFSLSSNVLLLSSKVYNQRNHNLTQHKPTTTSRLLCECELYAPQNYDNDPEMKSVMQDFDRQMSQRFREYGEHIIKNKQKCKEQCDKDIEKIILKDKIEKELKEKLDTLETNINTKDLPICECEKSLTDKVEKGCLGCGVLGSGIAPNVGLFGEVVLGAWKAAVLVTAKELAEEAGAAAGLKAGHAAGAAKVVAELEKTFGTDVLGSGPLGSIINAETYTDTKLISHAVYMKFHRTCMFGGSSYNYESPICTFMNDATFLSGNVSPEAVIPEKVIRTSVETMISDAKGIAASKAGDVTTTQTVVFEGRNIAAVDAAYTSSQIAIIASVVAILVIVLVMVIIYLILRYRRKKKMKKKLQYIKLLKE
ncbi:PIR protein, putative [Plasmodium sp. gorilla clade G1]|nr:PIR protein, putative [Plasmodium sp. gorilla clade G1]